MNLNFLSVLEGFNESEISFGIFAVFLIGFFIGILARKYYKKWQKKEEKKKEFYHDAHLSENEAKKLHEKLVDSRVEVGVKPPKTFKTKRKPQNTKVLGKKSLKKDPETY